MGHRLTKIYTRTGDKGTTGLADGSRVNKDDLRVETFGTLDELNSALGIVLAEKDLPDEIKKILMQIQNDLFDLGSEFCLPGYKAISQNHIDDLEKAIDHFNENLPPLKEFILPGGHIAAAYCHLARTICRRAERIAVTLSKEIELNTFALIYLNRLSDLLFVIPRVINQAHQIKEPQWQHERKK